VLDEELLEPPSLVELVEESLDDVEEADSFFTPGDDEPPFL
jgi:hypothetical protein